MKKGSVAQLLGFAAVACLSAQSAVAQQYAPTLMEYLQNDGRFTTFLHLAQTTGLDSYLKNYSVTGYTIVAPTNDAFSRLPASVMAHLGKNRVELAKVVEYHILPRERSALDIGMSPKTVEGELLNLTGGVPKRTARILSPDIEADNGKLDIVDQVLFPPEVFRDLQRDGLVPITTGLPISPRMTAAGVVQNVSLGNSYTKARKRARARGRWNRIRT
jgi:uncharacterized surface protein with fasciclin (FAS1) repeats